MEIKQHRQADKTINRALATFTDAANQVKKGIELKEASIEVDKNEMARIEDEIIKLELQIDELQAGIITKQREINQHKELAHKLEAFTL